LRLGSLQPLGTTLDLRLIADARLAQFVLDELENGVRTGRMGNRLTGDMGYSW
jgi:hypothetical protein